MFYQFFNPNIELWTQFDPTIRLTDFLLINNNSVLTGIL